MDTLQQFHERLLALEEKTSNPYYFGAMIDLHHSEIFQRSEKSTVLVQSEGCGCGTGFMVWKNDFMGLFVTNRHVLGDRDRYNVSIRLSPLHEESFPVLSFLFDPSGVDLALFVVVFRNYEGTLVKGLERLSNADPLIVEPHPAGKTCSYMALPMVNIALLQLV